MTGALLEAVHNIHNISDARSREPFDDGCFWWVDVARSARGRFVARGNLGQFIYVVPDKDLVVVRMGESFGYNRWPELLRPIADNAPS